MIHLATTIKRTATFHKVLDRRQGSATSVTLRPPETGFERGGASMLDQPDGSATPRPVGRVVAVMAIAIALVIAIVIVIQQASADRRPATTASSSQATSALASPDAGASTAEPSGSRSPAANQPSRKVGATSAPTQSPVPIQAPAEIKPGLVAQVTRLEAVEGEASGPGEIAGPAIRFDLEVRNDMDQELPLTTTVVNMYYGKAETPASALTEPGGVPLPATIPARGEASGTFVFMVPPKKRGRVLITVDYAVDVSLVAFRGSAPRP